MKVYILVHTTFWKSQMLTTCTIRAQLSRAVDVIFSLYLHVQPYLPNADREGYCKTAWMRRLVWALASCRRDKKRFLIYWLKGSVNFVSEKPDLGSQ